PTPGAASQSRGEREPRARNAALAPPGSATLPPGKSRHGRDPTPSARRGSTVHTSPATGEDTCSRTGPTGPTPSTAAGTVAETLITSASPGRSTRTTSSNAPWVTRPVAASATISLTAPRGRYPAGASA